MALPMVAETKIAQAMFDEAARRGLCGKSWHDAWWWQDQERAVTAYALLGAHPDAMRMAVPGGGAAWVLAPWSEHAEYRTLRVIAVCSDNAGVDAEEAPAAYLWRIAKSNPHQWVTWREAQRMAKAQREAPDIRVGQWVGGADKERAVLGLVVDLRPDGMPNRLQVGETVFRAPLSVRRWFVWGGEARQKAAQQLGDGGQHEFKSYMAMRSVVTAKARRLLEKGLVPQDTRWPLKLGWRRGPKPKA